MQVLDIIRRAAFNSGTVTSFNPEELPGDVETTGYHLLAKEIIPALSCDRSLDVTVVARTYTPTTNSISLRALPPDSNYFIIGNSVMLATELLLNFASEATRLLPTIADWPTDDAGVPRTVAIWSADQRLVYATTLLNAAINADVNIEFLPMRVDALFEDTSRLEYKYLYRREYESIDYFAAPFVYTTETYENELVILWHAGTTDKRVVLPMPLFIVRDMVDANPYAGVISGPAKFEQYIVDALAVRLAIVYGLSTVATMQTAAMTSYNLLKKNMPMPTHSMDVRTSIRDVLRRR